MSSTYEQAQQRFDWEEYIKHHGGMPEIQGGGEYIMDCPVCQKPKMAINVKTRKWRCFTCEEGGYDATSLVVWVQQMLWHEAMAVVMTGEQRTIGRIDRIEFEEQKAPLRPPSWIPRQLQFPPGWEPVGSQSPAGMLGIAYCQKRGIPEYVVQEMRLGVCTQGRFTKRLIFPCYDNAGRLIFYQGRAMWNPRQNERHIKTLSSKVQDPATDAGAGDCLLNLQYLVAQKQTERLLVVEGPVDAAHAWPDAVCVFGKRISPRQIELLMRAGVRELDLGLDPDAIETVMKQAPGLADIFKLRIVTWPQGTDPGELTKEQIDGYRAQAVEWGTGERLRKLTNNLVV